MTCQKLSMILLLFWAVMAVHGGQNLEDDWGDDFPTHLSQPKEQWGQYSNAILSPTALPQFPPRQQQKSAQVGEYSTETTEKSATTSLTSHTLTKTKVLTERRGTNTGSTDRNKTTSSEPTGMPSQIPSNIPTLLPSNVPSTLPTIYSDSSSMYSSYKVSGSGSYSSAFSDYSDGSMSFGTKALSSGSSMYSSGRVSSSGGFMTSSSVWVTSMDELFGQPTSQPTGQPTRQPTGQPTGQPTSQPTGKPSAVPSTSQPSTSSPSSQPSEVPWAYPTGTPLSKPSSYPTAAPTGTPITSVPTLPDDTNQPTSYPSTLPPTSMPTSMPTLTQETRWRDIGVAKVRQGVADMAIEYNVTARETTETVMGFLNGQSIYTSVETGQQQCDNYGRAVKDMFVFSSTLLTSGIGVGVLATNRTSPGLFFSCGGGKMDEDKVDTIISALIEPDGTTTVTCNDAEWVVLECSSLSGEHNVPVSALCVSGSDKCSELAEGSGFCSLSETEVESDTLLFAPCSGVGLGSQNHDGSGYLGHSTAVASLSSYYRDLAEPPAITFIDTDYVDASDVLRVTVEVADDTNGDVTGTQVYCSAFAQVDVQQRYDVPTSVNQVFLKNYGGRVVQGETSVVLEIPRLTKARDFDVYCLTISPEGPTMSLDNMLLTRTPTETPCCRSVKLDMAVSVVTETVEYDSIGVLTVSTPPDVKLELIITAVKSNDLEGDEFDFFFPKRIVVDQTSRGFSQALSFTAPLGKFGEYVLKVSREGTSKHDYSLDFVKGKVFMVQELNEPVPPPKYMTAIFSDSGAFVDITFDTATDRAGIEGDFVCSDLFDFSNATLAACTWAESSVVRVSLATSVTVNSIITLLTDSTAGKALKAACTTSDCSSWSAVADQLSTRVLAPVTAVTPKLSLLGDDTVPDCTSLDIEIVADNGGGRPLVMQYSHTASNMTNAVEIDRELALQLKTVRGGFKIAAHNLITDARYHFSVTACNFLGKCATALKSVSRLSIIRPIVTIAQGTIQIRRDRVLEIYSDAFFPNCDGSKDFTGLRFEPWVVREDGVISDASRLTSTAADLSVFRLPPYSLRVGSEYVMTIGVTKMGIVYGASAKVSVLVTAGDIVAKIAGGSSVSLKAAAPNSRALMDASGSYDTDVQGLTGSDAGLSFSWSCQQTKPTKNQDDCPGISLNNRGEAVAVIDYQQEATTSVLKLVVSSAGRSEIKEVTVHTLKASAPVVATSVGFVSQFLVDDEIAFTGLIDIQSDAVATWSVSPAIPGFASKIKSGLVSVTLRKSEGLSRQFGLALYPLSMIPGMTYSFTLTCTDALFPDRVASTAVTVVTNQPPQPGSVDCQPREAKEYRDDGWELRADDWIDPESDGELRYVFGHVDKGVEAILSDASPRSSAAGLLLPAGNSAKGYRRTLFFKIYDALGSHSTAYDYVTVFPMVGYVAPSDENPAETEEEAAAAAEAAAEARTTAYANFVANSGLSNVANATSPVELKKAKIQIAALSASINQVRCDMTFVGINCTALFRGDCVDTDRTCGTCVEGYVGEDGDANTACIDPTPAPMPTSVNDDTEPVPVRVIQKKCPGACSNKGTCTYQATATDTTSIDVCPLTDPCVAVCECDTGYVGSDCRMTSGAMAAAKALRESLLDSFLATKDSSFAEKDKSSIEADINQVNSLAANADELSETAKAKVVEIAGQNAVNGDDLGIDGEKIKRSMASLEKGLKGSKVTKTGPDGARRLVSSSGGGGGGGRRLTADDEVTIDFDTIIDTYLSFGEGAMERQVALQPADTLVTSGLRSASQVIDPSYTDDTVAVEAATTTLESFSTDFVNGGVSLNATAPVSVTVMSLTGDIAQGSANQTLTSNTMQVLLGNLPECDADPMWAEFDVVNIRGEYTKESMTFTSMCKLEDTTTHEYNCFNETITATCPGDVVGLMETNCTRSLEPSCLTGFIAGDDGAKTGACSVVSFDDTSTRCLCDLCHVESGLRRLSATHPFARARATATWRRLDVADDLKVVEIAAMAGHVLGEYASVMRDSASAFADGSAFVKARVVLVTFAVSWAICFAILVMSEVYNDIEAVSKFLGMDKDKREGRKRSGSGLDTPELESEQADEEDPAKRANDYTVLPSGTWIPLGSGDIKAQEQMIEYIFALLPSLYKPGLKQWERLFEQFLGEHLLCSIFTSDTQLERSISTLELASTIALEFFLVAFFCDLEFPQDDGTCTPHSDEETCLTRKSYLDISRPYCTWNPAAATNPAEPCYWEEPEVSNTVLIIMTVVIALLATPLIILESYLFDHLLRVPTARALDHLKGIDTPMSFLGVNLTAMWMSGMQLLGCAPPVAAISNQRVDAHVDSDSDSVATSTDDDPDLVGDSDSEENSEDGAEEVRARAAEVLGVTQKVKLSQTERLAKIERQMNRQTRKAQRKVQRAKELAELETTRLEIDEARLAHERVAIGGQYESTVAPRTMHKTPVMQPTIVASVEMHEQRKNIMLTRSNANLLFAHLNQLQFAEDKQKPHGGWAGSGGRGASGASFFDDGDDAVGVRGSEPSSFLGAAVFTPTAGALTARATEVGAEYQFQSRGAQVTKNAKSNSMRDSFSARASLLVQGSMRGVGRSSASTAARKRASTAMRAMEYDIIKYRQMLYTGRITNLLSSEKLDDEAGHQNESSLPGNMDERDELVRAFDHEWGILSVNAADMRVTWNNPANVVRHVTRANEDARQMYDCVVGSTNTSAGIALMELFVLGECGYNSAVGNVFRVRSNAEFHTSRTVSEEIKTATVVLVLALDIFFIYSSMAYGITKGIAWQFTWLEMCVGMIFLDILVKQSMEAIILAFVLPGQIHRQVMKVADVLVKSVKRITRTDYNASRDAGLFSASEYLNASTILGRKMPHMWEATVVLSQRDPLPQRHLGMALTQSNMVSADGKRLLPSATDSSGSLWDDQDQDEEEGYDGGGRGRGLAQGEVEVGHLSDMPQSSRRGAFSPLLVRLTFLLGIFAGAGLYIASLPFDVQRVLVDVAAPFFVGAITIVVLSYSESSFPIQILIITALSAMFIFGPVWFISDLVMDYYKPTSVVPIVPKDVSKGGDAVGDGGAPVKKEGDNDRVGAFSDGDDDDDDDDDDIDVDVDVDVEQSSRTPLSREEHEEMVRMRASLTEAQRQRDEADKADRFMRARIDSVLMKGFKPADKFKVGATAVAALSAMSPNKIAGGKPKSKSKVGGQPTKVSTSPTAPVADARETIGHPDTMRQRTDSLVAESNSVKQNFNRLQAIRQNSMLIRADKQKNNLASRLAARGLGRNTSLQEGSDEDESDSDNEKALSAKGAPRQAVGHRPAMQSPSFSGDETISKLSTKVEGEDDEQKKNKKKKKKKNKKKRSRGTTGEPSRQIHGTVTIRSLMQGDDSDLVEQGSDGLHTPSDSGSDLSSNDSVDSEQPVVNDERNNEVVAKELLHKAQKLAAIADLEKDKADKSTKDAGKRKLAARLAQKKAELGLQKELELSASGPSGSKRKTRNTMSVRQRLQASLAGGGGGSSGDESGLSPTMGRMTMQTSAAPTSKLLVPKRGSTLGLRLEHIDETSSSSNDSSDDSSNEYDDSDEHEHHSDSKPKDRIGTADSVPYSVSSSEGGDDL